MRSLFLCAPCCEHSNFKLSMGRPLIQHKQDWTIVVWRKSILEKQVFAQEEIAVNCTQCDVLRQIINAQFSFLFLLKSMSNVFNCASRVIRFIYQHMFHIMKLFRLYWTLFLLANMVCTAWLLILLYFKINNLLKGLFLLFLCSKKLWVQAGPFDCFPYMCMSSQRIL